MEPPKFGSAHAQARAHFILGDLPSRREFEAQDARGAAVPDHPAVRALTSALMSAGSAAAAAGWREAQGCVESLQRIGLEPIRVRLPAWEAAEAWRALRAVTPLALDVLAVVLDSFGADGGEVRLVRCADILDAKGCRRRGEERLVQEELVGRELIRLGRLTIGADDLPLFSVTPVGDPATSFVVSLDPRARALWAGAPLRRVNWRLLQFDHRANRGADLLAKKLGFYFSLAGAGSKPVVRNVRSVLRAVGVLHDVAGGARGGRLADRFEEAILRLRERDLFAVAYRGFAPGLDDARTKGWVKRWLDADLVIQPSA